ncbi:MAG: uncharacterized protein KVP18_004125 [Porospora cf. gigantea A]|uniref:uncharacterized protein n=1 Tax=Porospora cf. gigantea A TaxID=2853593 RepID=UPI00355A38B6|nr:MAG: hypothetical protein KVP18_004125 [Porospora cf. gigantea A]
MDYLRSELPSFAKKILEVVGAAGEAEVEPFSGEESSAVRGQAPLEDADQQGIVLDSVQALPSQNDVERAINV